MVLPLLPLASALIPLVADAAPSIVRFLVADKEDNTPNRVEEAVGTVAKVVEAVTNQPINTPDDVAAAREILAQNPEKLAALQIELAKTNLEFERLDVEREKAILNDKQNARATSIARLQAGGSDWRGVMLVMAFVSIIAIVTLLVLKPDVSQTVVGFIIGIGGMFARNIGSAFDFEFGSSRGSKEKSSMLKEEIETAHKTAASATHLAKVGQAAGNVAATVSHSRKLREALASS